MYPLSNVVFFTNSVGKGFYMTLELHGVLVAAVG